MRSMARARELTEEIRREEMNELAARCKEARNSSILALILILILGSRLAAGGWSL